MPPIISIYSCAFTCALLVFPEHPIHITYTCKYLYGYLNSYGHSTQLIHSFSIFIACSFVSLFDVCTTAEKLWSTICVHAVYMWYTVHCLANTVRLLEYLFCMQCFILYVYSVPIACVCAPPQCGFRHFHAISLFYVVVMSLVVFSVLSSCNY